MEIYTDRYELGSVINDIKNMVIMSLLDKPIEFRIEVEEGIPAVLGGDIIRIRQILVNLLGNAVKFTNEGYIQLRISHVKLSETHVRLCMEVEDTGIGIEMRDMERLFETFNQVDTKKNRAVEGTGLGLAITKSAVQMHKGSVKVQSIPGVGSIFTVRIPLSFVPTVPSE